jgi:hypothetical protein
VRRKGTRAAAAQRPSARDKNSGTRRRTSEEIGSGQRYHESAKTEPRWRRRKTARGVRIDPWRAAREIHRKGNPGGGCCGEKQEHRRRRARSSRCAARADSGNPSTRLRRTLARGGAPAEEIGTGEKEIRTRRRASGEDETHNPSATPEKKLGRASTHKWKAGG